MDAVLSRNEPDSSVRFTCPEVRAAVAKVACQKGGTVTGRGKTCHPGRNGTTGTALNVMNLIMLMRTTAWPEAPIIKIHAVDADDVQRRLGDTVIFLVDVFKVISYKSSLISTFELRRKGWVSRRPWVMLLYLSAGTAPRVKGQPLMQLRRLPFVFCLRACMQMHLVSFTKSAPSNLNAATVNIASYYCPHPRWLELMRVRRGHHAALVFCNKAYQADLMKKIK